ncbi:MAG: TonB-dependent receptor [Candidatus Marinimicrobia bacterium]|nr:TonB-dependent receptor [Candidatus Neomarinimicrobiota bacterium]MBT4715832.1 TonB-dependent receptor [Candidatus Neomarinimicrobiota bacterium]MBT4947827.1 TonB-dependent receptor [Candidatus Neomarinimicrobiota bacterium]MBT5271314.1 TonB-dependent receptor [Candidatus Neomarinimicrobiota bacterium]MBT6009895.1 TonB-dependent receptor [Candidatus Neomarinimicrobiota bacterium]
MLRSIKYALPLILLTLITNILVAQPQHGQRRSGGNRPSSGIAGKVLDDVSGNPIQYANVMLHDSDTEAAITGTITDERGRFRITPVKPGHYFVTVKFMGYEELRIDSLTITMATPMAMLGRVSIVPATMSGESVVVERERTTMEYKIDKKVINVGQDITSSSGTAVEVLENVPSVQVDIEGNVELRGSSNFTVLIDNRPSILDGNEALQTIPASTIDNIEIITNPSAAYDPDGVSGIINIITKKSKLEGVSGIANLNAGMLGQRGGDFLVSYRNHKYTAYLSAAYHTRIYEGQDTSLSQTTIGDTLFSVGQLGDNRFQHGGYRLRTGIDFNLSDKDILGIKLSYGSRGFSRSGENSFSEYTNYFMVPIISTSEAISERGGVYYTLGANYEHQFSGPTHRLAIDGSYSIRKSDEESTTEQFDPDGNQISGKITTEEGPTTRGRLEIKYEQPIANDGKLEAGYQIRSGNSADESGLQEWDTTTTNYVTVDTYNYDTEYQRNIQSLFSVLSTNIGKLGVQGGFRAEYTFRNISVIDSIEFKIDRWDYFPTLHLSYNITPTQKFMTSYSKRIRRIHGYYLEPFETWTNAYNVRMGNPDLQPQHINAFEVGYMKYFGKNMISTEVYARETTNLVERVQSVYSENVILHTFDNVGNSLSIGSELSLRLMPFEWWDFNLMGNIYHYEINDQPASFKQNIESDNYSVRFNNNFTINSMIKLQMNAMYNSASVTAQGEREAMFFLNAGARLNIIENKLSASLNVRDILDTGDHEFTSSGDGWYRYQASDRVAPIFSASIKYIFNNYRSRDRNGNGDGMNGDESAEGDDF